MADASETANLEKYSTKIIVENIPVNVDLDLFRKQFELYGNVIVHWPFRKRCNRRRNTAYLYFEDQTGVENLFAACVREEDKYLFVLEFPANTKNKKVEIEIWKEEKGKQQYESDVLMDPDQSIFISKIKFPISGDLLRSIIQKKYDGVVHCSIIPNAAHKYPTDCAVVTFKDRPSYVLAVADGMITLSHEGKQQEVLIQPYILNNRLCEICTETSNFGNLAEFFCSHSDCLLYICQDCHENFHIENPSKCHHISYVYNVETKKFITEEKKL